mgnify:CR=1 FL=1
MNAAGPRFNSSENDVADIFQEIDEELRQDRAAKLWSRYGNYVIAAAVLIVLSVGGYKFWTAHDLESRQAESAMYQEAISRVGAGDVEGAISTLGDLARDAGSGYLSSSLVVRHCGHARGPPLKS